MLNVGASKHCCCSIQAKGRICQKAEEGAEVVRIQGRGQGIAKKHGESRQERFVYVPHSDLPICYALTAKNTALRLCCKECGRKPRRSESVDSYIYLLKKYIITRQTAN